MKALRWAVFPALLTIFATGCDQVTKWQAADVLSGGIVTVVPGFFDFRYAENPGAAFSFLAHAPRTIAIPILLGGALLAMAGLFVFLRKNRDRMAIVGGSLVLGGALGNAIDRVRIGRVIDFVHWHVRDVVDWPIFNVADVWIFLGVALLLLRSFRPPLKIAEPNVLE